MILITCNNMETVVVEELRKMKKKTFDDFMLLQFPFNKNMQTKRAKQ